MHADVLPIKKWDYNGEQLTQAYSILMKKLSCSGLAKACSECKALICETVTRPLLSTRLCSALTPQCTNAIFALNKQSQPRQTGNRQCKWVLIVISLRKLCLAAHILHTVSFLQIFLRFGDGTTSKCSDGQVLLSSPKSAYPPAEARDTNLLSW